jgi:hypothetical protein
MCDLTHHFGITQIRVRKELRNTWETDMTKLIMFHVQAVVPSLVIQSPFLQLLRQHRVSYIRYKTSADVVQRILVMLLRFRVISSLSVACIVHFEFTFPHGVSY